jgi:hypothetical protein
MEYKSLDTYEVKGRGKVFVVKNDKDRDRDKNDLIGSAVIIDGMKYLVLGVESFAVQKIAQGDKIGLLVSRILI